MEKKVKPEVGMGATICLWTDRNPATITRVSPSGKTIWYREDDYEVVSGSMQDGSAEYTYRENPKALEEKATLRKDGRYRKSGTDCIVVLVGFRDKYYDPSF